MRLACRVSAAGLAGFPRCSRCTGGRGFPRSFHYRHVLAPGTSKRRSSLGRKSRVNHLRTGAVGKLELDVVADDELVHLPRCPQCKPRMSAFVLKGFICSPREWHRSAVFAGQSKLPATGMMYARLNRISVQGLPFWTHAQHEHAAIRSVTNA